MVDPITLEVLRCKLEAIADDGAKTVIRTAISPVVADAGDCSCAVYDRDGGLIVGGGAVQAHFHTGQNGVLAIRKIHGDTIADGDIFLVNDPYAGGGFHAQDVFFHVPVFVDGVLSAWVGSSAHMMDMGGQVMGSFVPSATECYQEALRLPPVRVYRKGEEQGDVWAIVRNNIRMANLVEMDMRALIAGSTVLRAQLLELVAEYGADTFIAAVDALADLTEQEVRRRILEIEPGVYRAESWSEWTEELFHVPCTLTIKGDHLIFDYRDACDQSNHYFNSKPYVIQSLLGVTLGAYLAQDLPFNEGMFRTFEILCRPGSILDAQPPAPIGAPHLDVGQLAAEVAMRAFNLALAASPNSRARRNMAGSGAGSAFALHTMVGVGLNGQMDGWLLLDGAATAASACHDHDSPDMWYEAVGKGVESELIDVEILESWYPIQIEYRRPRRGVAGAGKFRAGGGSSMAYRVAGTRETTAAIMGNRERVPIVGTAGGLPGALTRYAIRKADGEVVAIGCHRDGVVLQQDEAIIFETASGGGWGDPLDRDPAAVEADIRQKRVTVEEAREVYGVFVGDLGATEHCRQETRAKRLKSAKPATQALNWTAELRKMSEGDEAPLCFGVTQRGSIAVSDISGAPLAVSPDHWTDGCPVIERFLPSHSDARVLAYLDPETGRLLAVDVVAESVQRSFTTMPDRWRASAHVAPAVASAVAAE